MFTKMDGIILNPVFTGKAGLALIWLALAGDITADTSTLFYHTGTRLSKPYFTLGLKEGRLYTPPLYTSVYNGGIVMQSEMTKFKDTFDERLAAATKEKVRIVVKEQYADAFAVLEDCENADLIPGIIGPPGVGKTLILRAYAEKSERDLYWITGDEGVRPSHLTGAFNPSIVLNKGFTLEAFEPGPLLKSMVFGGVFGLNEGNRLSEYVQNSLLDPFEERSINVQRLGRIRADKGFFPVLTMNPEEMSGAHRLSEALRDRVRVWIKLGYPRKETEIEIVKMNCPEYKLSDAVLEKVYGLVSSTRVSTDIEMPASIRAGISISRLAAQMTKRKKEKTVTHATLSKAATYVLVGALRFRPGIDPEPAVNSLVRRNLGS